MSRIALFILILFGFSQYALSQDRTLVAEGDYSAEKKDGPTTLAHWKLWQLSNGEYDVIESSAKNPHLTQTFRFDGQFLPIGYSLDISPPSTDEVNQRPEAAKLFHPMQMNVSCEYRVQELRCVTDYDGHKSVASIAAQYPYVFFPGEFYAMDLTWFLTGVVHLLEQGNVQGHPVNIYIMEDSPTNWRLGEIVLKADQPLRLYFTGDGTSTVMGKAQRTRNYEGWGPSELSVLRVTSQGVVALISGKATPDVGFEITNFVEHEPWPLPFRPVLDATQLPTPIPSATQADTSGMVQRVRVPGGIMQGLLMHRVQPVYPESAKQEHIEGQVVLSAIIGTNGQILEVKALSGPAELVPAAISAVQQWEYRPYVRSGQATEVETEIQLKFTLSH